MSEDCLFCKFIRGDIKPDKVYEDEDLFAFRDINPQARTHILIVPKRHIATLNDLQPSDTELVGKMFVAAARLAKKDGVSEVGYRTVFNCNAAAGQTVFHIHLHLLGGREFGWPPG